MDLRKVQGQVINVPRLNDESIDLISENEFIESLE
jgi:hypothetical protein